MVTFIGLDGSLTNSPSASEIMRRQLLQSQELSRQYNAMTIPPWTDPIPIKSEPEFDELLLLLIK